MNFLNYYIPLLSYFIDGFWDLFLVPLLCLAFIATVPYMIRVIVKLR